MIGLPPSLSGAAHLRATELLSVPVMSGVPGLPGTAAHRQAETMLLHTEANRDCKDESEQSSCDDVIHQMLLSIYLTRSSSSCEITLEKQNGQMAVMPMGFTYTTISARYTHNFCHKEINPRKRIGKCNTGQMLIYTHFQATNSY